MLGIQSSGPGPVVRNAIQSLLRQRLRTPLGGALERLFPVAEMERVYADILRMPREGSFCEKALAALDVGYRVRPEDLARIPRQGPLVAVANHPFGLAEGAVLAALLPRIRPDVKILANFMLAWLPEVREQLILVDPFGGEESLGANRKGLREAIEWLWAGKMLVVFPAGEVSHFDLRKRAVTDPEWSHTTSRLIRIAECPAVPVYFAGANSALFQVLGMLNPSLRTVLLARELLNKQGRKIEVRIGNPIPYKKLAAFPEDQARTLYLRRRTYLLAHRRSAGGEAGRRPAATGAGPGPLGREVRGLNRARLLLENGGFEVYLAPAGEMPNLMQEIGRLRELTFRAVGEGTGKPVDLDRFDAFYSHLFLWNKAREEVVGAYRIGATDELLARFGKRGLYTYTLFRYRDEFLRRISPALEMGRSFVRPEYQKEYAPLLLLWKGIGAFVAANPRYRVLFGPVSISNDYHPVSRELMVAYLSRHSTAPDLAGLVKPRKAPRKHALKGWDRDGVRALAADLEDLATLIGDIESDEKGVPVLLRQYLKLGGKLAGFNLDPRFSDALDGLIVVDLAETDPRVLERYMGKQGAAGFLGWNAGGGRTAALE